MKQVRDRIVTIERIYDKPVEKPMQSKKGERYSFFNLGIKLSEGDYCTISVSGKDLPSVQNKIDEKLKANGKKIKVGGQYKVYEESEDGKYWKVSAFCNINDPYTSLSDSKLAQIQDEVNEATGVSKVESKGGGSPQFNRDKSIVRQVMFKCAVDILEIGTPAQEVIKYAKELEEGFYEYKSK
jgi:hypothetical protein